MGQIIACHLELQERAEALVTAIENLGISRNKTAVFYLKPDGQHHLMPLGGDKNASPGASGSGKAAWVGSGVGAVAGAAVGSVAGPIGAVAGAGVGAYTGSLAGAVTGTDKTPESEDQTDSQEPAIDRKSGVHVAAEIDDHVRQDVVTLMRQYDGGQIEEAEGHIEDGEWIGFDPRQPVHPVT